MLRCSGLVEDVVGRVDRGGMGDHPPRRALAIAQGEEESIRKGMLAELRPAGDLDEDDTRRVRCQIELERGGIAGKSPGRRIEAQGRLARLPVETRIAERHPVGRELGRVVMAAMGAFGAANLEQVGVICDRRRFRCGSAATGH